VADDAPLPYMECFRWRRNCHRSPSGFRVIRDNPDWTLDEKLAAVPIERGWVGRELAEGGKIWPRPTVTLTLLPKMALALHRLPNRKEPMMLERTEQQVIARKTLLDELEGAVVRRLGEITNRCTPRC